MCVALISLLEGGEQAGFARSIHPAHGAMPLLHAFRLPVLPLLPADFLRPAGTDAKHPGKLCLCALARRISGQEHPSQIAIATSRHILREETLSFLIASLEML